MKLSLSKLKAYAEDQGLMILAHTDMRSLLEDREALEQWQSQGYAAELEYMKRDPSLLSSPERLFPGGGSILSFAIQYSHYAPQALEPAHGRIARYAVGKDYHRVLKKRLSKFINAIREDYGDGIDYRVFSDAVPLLERALARRSGLGFQGKNTMLIIPRVGSYFFLAEVLWNVEIEGEGLPVLKDDCGSCQRCQSACPTNALVADHILDARKCISYLTIEKRGWLSFHERCDLGEWIFGCDICQEVCPFNHRSHRLETFPDVEEFQSRYTVPGQLSLEWLLTMSNDDRFKENFAGTPLMRAKRKGVIRNAAAVCANIKAYELEVVLTRCMKEDEEILCRFSAAAALLQLHADNQVSRSRIQDWLIHKEGARGRLLIEEIESKGEISLSGESW